jgi:hypothetical protein
MRDRTRRGRGVDYGKEVPFEVKPVPGFYDTGGETRPRAATWPCPTARPAWLSDLRCYGVAPNLCLTAELSIAGD